MTFYIVYFFTLSVFVLCCVAVKVDSSKSTLWSSNPMSSPTAPTCSIVRGINAFESETDVSQENYQQDKVLPELLWRSNLAIAASGGEGETARPCVSASGFAAVRGAPGSAAIDDPNDRISSKQKDTSRAWTGSRLAPDIGTAADRCAWPCGNLCTVSESSSSSCSAAEN